MAIPALRERNLMENMFNATKVLNGIRKPESLTDTEVLEFLIDICTEFEDHLQWFNQYDAEMEWDYDEMIESYCRNRIIEFFKQKIEIERYSKSEE